MRKYTILDLVRFNRFANENSDRKPYTLIKEYDEKYPEISPKQQLINLAKALKMPELIAAIEKHNPEKQ